MTLLRRVFVREDRLFKTHWNGLESSTMWEGEMGRRHKQRGSQKMKTTVAEAMSGWRGGKKRLGRGAADGGADEEGAQAEVTG